MNAPLVSCLSERHLLLFARIIRSFASYERLIDEAVSTLAGCNSACLVLITREYDFRARRRMMLDLLHQLEVPLDRFDRISAHLMVPYTYSVLLHDIIHSEWVPHVQTNGIQPSWIFRLSPMVSPLRDGNDVALDHPLEREPDEPSYTLADLEDIADTLSGGCRALAQYLNEVNLIQPPG